MEYLEDKNCFDVNCADCKLYNNNDKKCDYYDTTVTRKSTYLGTRTYYIEPCKKCRDSKFATYLNNYNERVASVFNEKVKKLLLKLISSEQINMLIDKPDSYVSAEYMSLEHLKVKIKNF